MRVLGLRAGGAPNPTRATPVHKVILDKPIIKVPGCPPIAEVMTGVVTYMLTFDRIPELDRQGGPRCSTASASTTSATAVRTSTRASLSNPSTTKTRKGYCLYKVGCKGPTTYNACSTVRWNDGTSWPVQSGHGCLAARKRASGTRLVLRPATNIHAFGVESNADKVGVAAAGAVGAAVAAHAAVSMLKRASDKNEPAKADH